MTCISITRKTKNRLEKFGIKSSTWDSIIIELMNHVKKCDKFWVDKK